MLFGQNGDGMEKDDDILGESEVILPFDEKTERYIPMHKFRELVLKDYIKLIKEDVYDNQPHKHGFSARY